METSSAYFRDERSIIGAYKADKLTESDEIYARKCEILDMLSVSKKLMKFFSISHIVFVLLIMVVSLPAAIGWFFTGGIIYIPMLISLNTSKKRAKTLEVATEKYCKELGIDSV